MAFFHGYRLFTERGSTLGCTHLPFFIPVCEHLRRFIVIICVVDLPKGILLRELRGSGSIPGLVTSAAYTTKSALLFVVRVLIRSLLPHHRLSTAEFLLVAPSRSRYHSHFLPCEFSGNLEDLTYSPPSCTFLAAGGNQPPPTRPSLAAEKQHHHKTSRIIPPLADSRHNSPLLLHLVRFPATARREISGFYLLPRGDRNSLHPGLLTPSFLLHLVEHRTPSKLISAVVLIEMELAEERTEDHDTTSSQPRRSDRCGFPYGILVTSHYFASVALSVRGWIGAWPGLVDGTGTRPGESGRAGLCDLGGLDSDCVGIATSSGKAKALNLFENLGRYSTSGGCQFLGGRLVSWQSRKQNCITLSSTEAEYIAAVSSCFQVLWMKTQLMDYGFRFTRIPIYCDPSSPIAISHNPIQHTKTKHIDIRYHFIKDYVFNGDVELIFVKSPEQIADVFTKALDESKCFGFLNMLGLMLPEPHFFKEN
ncbi:hypothetical protein LXL04_034187 [Taraxacum kok-saghyz]